MIANISIYPKVGKKFHEKSKIRTMDSCRLHRLINHPMIVEVFLNKRSELRDKQISGGNRWAMSLPCLTDEKWGQTGRSLLIDKGVKKANSTKEFKCHPGQPGHKHLSVTGLISNFGSELSVSILSPFRDVIVRTYTCVCVCACTMWEWGVILENQ